MKWYLRNRTVLRFNSKNGAEKEGKRGISNQGKVEFAVISAAEAGAVGERVHFYWE